MILIRSWYGIKNHYFDLNHYRYQYSCRHRIEPRLLNSSSSLGSREAMWGSRCLDGHSTRAMRSRCVGGLVSLSHGERRLVASDSWGASVLDASLLYPNASRIVSDGMKCSMIVSGCCEYCIRRILSKSFIWKMVYGVWCEIVSYVARNLIETLSFYYGGHQYIYQISQSLITMFDFVFPQCLYFIFWELSYFERFFVSMDKCESILRQIWYKPDMISSSFVFLWMWVYMQWLLSGSWCMQQSKVLSNPLGPIPWTFECRISGTSWAVSSGSGSDPGPIVLDGACSIRDSARRAALHLDAVCWLWNVDAGEEYGRCRWDEAVRVMECEKWFDQHWALRSSDLHDAHALEA